MNTYSAKPNVRVTVNGIPSACNTDCTYDFLSSVPKVTAATLSGYTLSLILTDPVPLNANLSKVTVTLDGQPCKILDLTKTMTNFSCILPNNTDGSAVLRAGDYFPVVKIDPVGYVDIDAAVVAINVPLNLTSAVSSTGGTNGGQIILINAIGLPLNPSEINFTLCSRLCTINSISNTAATIVLPVCSTTGLTNIEAAYNSKLAIVEFTYVNVSDTVQINLVTPQSWSPVMKGVISINGSGFGSNSSQLNVYLTNSSGNIYKMKIL